MTLGFLMLGFLLGQLSRRVLEWLDLKMPVSELLENYILSNYSTDKENFS